MQELNEIERIIQSSSFLKGISFSQEPIRDMFGFLYGALTAAVYLGLKQFSYAGGLPLFVQICFILFLLHLLLFPQKIMNGLTNGNNIMRGVLFGLAQTCLLQAQAYQGTSAVFIAAVAGVVTASFVGQYLLGEQRSSTDSNALFLCVLGLVIGEQTLHWSPWALLGGMFQGLTAVVARLIMRNKQNMIETIGIGFFFGGLLGLIGLLITGKTSIFVFDPHLLLIGIIFIVIVQYMFFLLYRMYDVQKATILSISRIPFAFFFEYIFLGAVPQFTKLISALLIMTGFATLVVGRKD